MCRFLEDGDLHTDHKRNRQFKWKGLDDGIELDKRDSDSEQEEGEEDATAEKWRLQRVEREKWMKGRKLMLFSLKVYEKEICRRIFTYPTLKCITDPDHQY